MNSSQELAEILTRMQQQIDALGSPQLGYSSLEDGYVNQYEQDQLASRWGRQYDGTNGISVLAGPVPPTPSGLTVEPTLNGIRVFWDGSYVQTPADRDAGRPTVAPMDFLRVEIHACSGPPPVGFGLFAETFRGAFSSPRGGEFVHLTLDPDEYVTLVLRTAPGKASAAADVVGPVQPRKAGIDDLDLDLSELGGGTTIHYGPDQPTDAEPGDIWYQPVGSDGAARAYRLQADGTTWAEIKNPEALQAIADAAQAAQEAEQAGQDALAALAAANGKSTVFYQDSPPGAGMVSNDLWVDTDDGNKLYVYTSASWTLSQDAGIASALSNAQTALTTANGKITVFAQTSAPSTTGRTMGDLWIDTDDSNVTYTWSGSAWVIRKVGSTAIDATARQLGGITTYFQTSQPASGMLPGDLWIDTDDANKVYRYGTSWVVADDQRIGTALTTATGAQATANLKVIVFAQTSPPSTSGRGMGDTWIDTDAGNAIYTWSGSAWTLRPLGGGALNLTVPFDKVAGDGKDSITLGTDVPAELKQYLDTAIKLDSGTWDPAKTTQQVKYFGIGSKGNYFMLFCYVTNWAGGSTNRFIQLQTSSFTEASGLVNTLGPYSAQSATFNDTYGLNLIYGGHLRDAVSPYPQYIGFVNGWLNGTTDFGGDLDPVSVVLSADGMVHITGLAKMSSTGLQRGQERDIIQLGAIYRPSKNVVATVTVAGEQLVRCDIKPTGRVTLMPQLTNVPANYYFMFDITYRAKGNA